MGDRRYGFGHGLLGGLLLTFIGGLQLGAYVSRRFLVLTFPAARRLLFRLLLVHATFFWFTFLERF